MREVRVRGVGGDRRRGGGVCVRTRMVSAVKNRCEAFRLSLTLGSLHHYFTTATEYLLQQE